MGGPLGDPFHQESRGRGPLCNGSAWLALLRWEPMLLPASTSSPTFPLALLSLLPCVGFSESCPAHKVLQTQPGFLCTGRFASIPSGLCLFSPSLSLQRGGHELQVAIHCLGTVASANEQWNLYFLHFNYQLICCLIACNFNWLKWKMNWHFIN